MIVFPPLFSDRSVFVSLHLLWWVPLPVSRVDVTDLSPFSLLSLSSFFGSLYLKVAKLSW